MADYISDIPKFIVNGFRRVVACDVYEGDEDAEGSEEDSLIMEDYFCDESEADEVASQVAGF